MSFLATFIGIDKHLDPAIRDLTGARRDATAMHALFLDSIPHCQARLLTDQQATHERVDTALRETLLAATADDVVVLFFAGHGTRDHRLVTHNTTVASLSDTTIPMERIADLFRSSKARAILCVLDCCFSGAAPARVLESSPLVRDPTDPLAHLAGEGRVLISASALDQPAYEHPATSHGLLTSSLIDAFLELSEPTSILAVMEKAMNILRARANGMGVSQTPVLFGSVTGGLSLPLIRPGTAFYAAFPERKGVRVGPDIHGLRPFGLSDPILDAWAQRYPKGLNELQLEAINDSRILDGESLLVIAPTSSGKTFIGEMAAAKALIEGRKTVFLMPYPALVNEKYEQFSGLYGEALSMRVVRCTGDYLDQTDPFVRGRYDLALLTYEMFLRLIVTNPACLYQIGLVVVDEAQFITDPTRGITVELLLTYLLAAREKGLAPQLIALSAVIGDMNKFHTWLRLNTLISAVRPVPLIEGVLGRDGAFRAIDPDGTERREQLLEPGSVRVRKEKPSAQDILVPLTRALVHAGEKVIIFRNMRGPARGCANYLADELGLTPATDALALLPGLDLTSASNALRTSLNGGVAFHTSDLTREERLVIEQVFREPKSKVRVLVATTTVAAGINTPASTVILAEQEFVGDDGRPFTVAEYKNMAGRAGRLGFQEKGKSIILADNIYDADALFARYVAGKLESLSSSFSPEHLDTWLLRLLAQVPSVPKSEVARLLANTYGGFLLSASDPDWHQRLTRSVERIVQEMLTLKIVEEERGTVRLTLLGRACASSPLSFGSSLRLVEMVNAVPSARLRPETLLALIQVLDESSGGYTPMMRRGRGESSRPQEAAQRYGGDVASLLQRHAKDMFDYQARCKRAALLWDWVRGAPLEEIEKLYSATPYQGRIGHGDVRKFADNARSILRSAFDIVTLIRVERSVDEERLADLLKQLEVGLPQECLGLLRLPIQLARGEHLAFLRAHVTTPEALWQMSSEELERIVGPSAARLLEKHRPKPAQGRAATPS